MIKTNIMTFLQQYQTKLQNFGVNRISLFGSFCRDKATVESDIDIFVIFQPSQKNFNNFMELCFFLEDNLGRKIDLITPELLNPHFGQKILDGGEYVLFP